MKILSICLLLLVSNLCCDALFAQSTSLVEKKGIVVNPVDRSQTQSLIDAGTIDTEGYTEMVINMAGMPGAAVQKAGTIGAILIPDIPPFDDAFKQWGILPAIIELTGEIKMGEKNFVAKQKRFDVGFPRYRLLLYNTSDSNMNVAVFIYRTHR